jgi:hypothetical protein
MILTGENWSTGRETLYSVGGRWTGLRSNDRLRGLTSTTDRLKVGHSAQTGSGARPPSYTKRTVGSSSGHNAARAWDWPLISIYCRGCERVALSQRSGLQTLEYYGTTFLRNVGNRLPNFAESHPRRTALTLCSSVLPCLTQQHAFKTAP